MPAPARCRLEYFVPYYRVSTERQGRSGLGLEAQQEAISNFKRSRPDATFLQEFTEVESGTRKGNARPRLQQAIEFARAKNATLLIAKLDRLARNVHFVSGLMESKVNFLALDLPEANRLTIHIMAAFAEHEADCISQRTKAALAARKARGLPLGNPQNLLDTHRAAGRIEIARQRREKALHFSFQVAPLLTKLQNEGLSLNKIAHELNTRQISTASGRTGSWTATAVKNCLAWAVQ